MTDNVAPQELPKSEAEVVNKIEQILETGLTNADKYPAQVVSNIDSAFTTSQSQTETKKAARKVAAQRDSETNKDAIDPQTLDANAGVVAKLRVRDSVGLQNDPSFVGLLQGVSPDGKRCLLTVAEQGITPHRKGKNVWFPSAQIVALSAKQADDKIKTGKKVIRDTIVTEPTVEDTMTNKSKTSKKAEKTASKKAASKKAANKEKKAASTRVTATTITKEALEALPIALRKGIQSKRLSWTTPVFPEGVKLIRFPKDTKAGAYKAGGHIWGYTQDVDKEFGKYWHFHFQYKSDGTAIAGRALAYATLDAAKHQAHYEAVYLGVKDPEHFTLTF